MTFQVRLTVSRFEGKWVAQEMRARKIEGHAFGAAGIETRNMGRFATKEQALVVLAQRKAELAGSV